MTETGSSTFDRALDGTAYWTLSLYVAAESLAPLYSPELIANPGAALRSAQLRHKPSFALRNAIDPLFNDIADRDFFGRPRDFLFAAGMGADNAGVPWSLDDAAEAIRTETELTFTVPPHFSWVTEGVRFHCDLKEELRRKVRLRRFWFAHSDGALSYHLSFEHHYRSGPEDHPRDILHDPYGMQTFYFLSLLQKLAAPKEFMLGEDQLEALFGADGKEVFLNPFLGDTTGIDPLDKIAVHEGAKASTFWRFVRSKFIADARTLLSDVLNLPGALSDARLDQLPQMTEVIEVPGLKLPRCRYLFHINDQRFFNRLLPIDPGTQEGLARKLVVREQCFAPFRDKINRLTQPADGRPPQAVWLGAVNNRPGLAWAEFDLTSMYDFALANEFFRAGEREHDPLITDERQLQALVHAGKAWQFKDKNGQSQRPEKLYIPAYETGRADCLDYLFLSGFNQNIIDWLNQDTSEILDSIDPIYPVEDVQADERFFVRYASHRGMITYVAGSRSLEIGNDYLGTCPYAFLMHVLALHNEFLARDHEKRSQLEIDDIDRQIEQIRASGAEVGELMLKGIEEQVNQLKRSTYRDYERHRYLNIFRYDTEQVVFAKLAKLRGTDWRGTAMTTALATLEEYAADLDRRARNRAAEDRRDANEKSAEREKRLGRLGMVIGAIGGVSILTGLADYFAKHPRFGPPGREPLVPYLFGNLAWILAIVGLVALVRLGYLHWRERNSASGDDA